MTNDEARNRELIWSYLDALASDKVLVLIISIMATSSIDTCYFPTLHNPGPITGIYELTTLRHGNLSWQAHETGAIFVARIDKRNMSCKKYRHLTADRRLESRTMQESTDPSETTQVLPLAMTRTHMMIIITAALAIQEVSVWTE